MNKLQNIPWEDKISDSDREVEADIAEAANMAANIKVYKDQLNACIDAIAAHRGCLGDDIVDTGAWKKVDDALRYELCSVVIRAMLYTIGVKSINAEKLGEHK